MTLEEHYANSKLERDSSLLDEIDANNKEQIRLRQEFKDIIQDGKVITFLERFVK